ncbi:MAG TPA: Rrf2 family transcriptional regulator [Steroidobacteraceae bacterium]|nr:Rrf2 family transcriptional regulator [Steroidobacteraceae bacterium]
MRLTSFTDYSLRVLMYVAARPQPQATIAEIAASFAVSESHLTKVVHSLGKQGVLVTVRGHGGGLALACPPDRINIGVVVRAAEAEGALVECFDRDTNRCVITSVCALRPVLVQALEAFYGVLGRYTLADITRHRRKLQHMLGLV